MRSRWGYAVAVVVAMVGVAVGVAVVVQGVTSYVDRVEGFQRVAAPGSGEVRFGEDGGYTLYDERPGAADGGSDLPLLGIDLRPVEGGPPLTLEPYDSDVTYDVSGYEGAAVASFSVDSPGAYRLIVDASSSGPGQVAVGRSVGRTLFLSIAGGVVGAVLAVLVGIILATVTGLRRSRARRSEVPPTGWR